MALRTHEFVECQEGKQNPGCLILSEVGILMSASKNVAKHFISSLAPTVTLVSGAALLSILGILEALQMRYTKHLQRMQGIAKLGGW